MAHKSFAGSYRMSAWNRRSALLMCVTMLVAVVSAGAASAAKWTFMQPPLPRGVHSGALNGVSCTSGSACVAVGYIGLVDVGFDHALVERWNGFGWSIEPSPHPSRFRGSSLTAVSCVSRRACTAVGHFANRLGETFTLAERWNGVRWSIEPTPNPAGSSQSKLTGVWCVSKSGCVAVGQTGSGVLVEVWNGTTWTVQMTGTPPGLGVYEPVGSFTGVSCTSMSACLAVGGTGGFVFAERWDGVAWSDAQAPDPGLDRDMLNAVSCASQTACAAVGSATAGGTCDLTVSEFWRAMAWSLQVSDHDGVGGDCTPSLHGVSCRSPSFCIAVGDVVERWNGRVWSVENQSLFPNFEELDAVSCTSRTSCVAVGHTYTTPNASVPLATRRT